MRDVQNAVQLDEDGKAQTSGDGVCVQENFSLSQLVDVFERVGGKIARGPAPSFNEAHVVKALEIIGEYGVVGRIILSEKLELGIGTTRTILKHLKREQLIVSSRNGFAFSDQGKQLFARFRTKISAGIQVANSMLTVGPVVVAVLVKGGAQKVGRGVAQRNTAIRAGASGATTLIFCDNKIVMPNKRNHKVSDMLKIQDDIISKLQPKENDAIILGSGENRATAEIGAIMAALKLLKGENNR
ncbi:MAG: hypothetical protein NWF03_01920 [Candidatus Bathyarchaeota archaeon]|nr:hypothetical protein [Candidatus Bathyarchaeota archaeon]